MKKSLQRVLALAAVMLACLLSGGCTEILIIKYAYSQITKDDPLSCSDLNSVQRAFNPRCGAYRPGSLLAKDVAAPGLEQCPLSLAAREPRFWPLLPELLAKGAQPEACVVAPMVALARSEPCPDFSHASPAELTSLRWLADADSRAIDRDVTHMLSCPSAVAVGLDSVLTNWQAAGLLPARGLWFNPLAALHPGYLHSPFARGLEEAGHSAATGAGNGNGGFEEALRLGDLAALDWWLARAPELANQVPPADAHHSAWVPLARVAGPRFSPDAATQERVVDYLLTHGADPMRHLPHDPGQTALGYAIAVKSPVAARMQQSVEGAQTLAVMSPALDEASVLTPALNAAP